MLWTRWRLALVLGLCVPSLLVSHSAERVAAQEPTRPPQAQGPPDASPPPPSKDDIVEGTQESDALTGTEADNWLFGREGDDFLRGLAGEDAVDGGDGADTLDGGDGDDVLDGGAGGDTLRGGGGRDIIDGGDDDDLIQGGDDDDDLDGGDGNDFIDGGPGDDVLAGGDGNDRLDGGPGNDRISGNDDGDSLLGGPGDDVLSGGEGVDLIEGGAGRDWLDGGEGDDVLRGGPDDDTLLGSAGADLLEGEAGHDVAVGGSGNDLLSGGPGDDLLVGSRGADIVRGGAGNDVVLLRAGDVPEDQVEIVDGEVGDDVLMLNGLDLRDGPSTRELTDPRTGGVYLLRSLERVEYTHVLPHADVRPDDAFSLLLVNPSEATAEGRVVLSGDDGAMLPVSVDGAMRYDVSFTVPPHGLVNLETIVSGGAAGPAQVFSSVPLGGLGASFLGAAPVAEVLLLDSATAPVFEDRETGASTGVTVVNGPVRSIVKLTLISETGGEPPDSGAEIDVPAYGRRTVFVRDLFPLRGDFRGTMTIEGGISRPEEGGPIGVTVLQRLGDRVVAAYPAVSVAPTPPAGPLLFADVPSGAASLTLVNPSTVDRAQGTVSFFDGAGEPRDVAVAGRAAAARVPFDLAPLGSIRLEMNAVGAATRGAARVDVTQGMVGGVVRVTSPAAGTFDSGPTRVLSDFIVPVRVESAPGVTTSLVITGTELAANLELTLRDGEGTALAGGTTTLRVPPNGQVTRSIAELFPGVPVTSLLGTLTATADAPVGVRATFSGGSLPMVLLPVTPLR